jgi:hypothetical protein
MKQERDSLFWRYCVFIMYCLPTAQRETLEGNHGAGAFRRCGVSTLKADLHGGNEP